MDIMEMKALEEIAVDQKLLATNFTDVIPDCCGADVDIKTELMNRHPLYTWLLGTQLSRRVRDNINGANGNCYLQKDANGKYVIKTPGSFWSLEPTDTSEECCWVPLDFAKCSGEVPVRRLCLKDCDNIDDELLGRVLRVNSSYGGVTRAGETYAETKKRIARLSMAFFTVYNVMYGRIGQTTPILKEFHGLFDVMSNAAVVSIPGANILSAFASLWCRLSLMGDTSGIVFGVNPIVYNSLLDIITADQFGRFPAGWSRSGDTLTFHGIRFIADRFVPVDMAAGTGEIWVLASDAVGIWMATDLMPQDAFIKESGHQEQSLENGCGSDCTYYYNFGSVFNNNANRIAKIVDVPISAACMATTGDLGGLIMPTTLIPTI